MKDKIVLRARNINTGEEGEVRQVYFGSHVQVDFDPDSPKRATTSCFRCRESMCYSPFWHWLDIELEITEQ